MIVDATTRVRGFMDFLNAKKLTNISCLLVVLPAHSSVYDEESKTYAFGCYLDFEKAMYVAGDLSGLEQDEQEQYRALCESIAHECAHHLQVVQGREISEEEAEELARKWVDEYLEGLA